MPNALIKWAAYWVHLRWTVVRPAAWPLLLGLIVSFLLVGIGAGREILYRIAEVEQLQNAVHWFRFLFGILILPLFCWHVWYASRTVLTIRYKPIKQILDGHQKELGLNGLEMQEITRWWRKWPPRLIAIIPLIVAGYVYAVDQSDTKQHFWFAAGAFALALLLLLFFIYRSQIFKELDDARFDTPLPKMPRYVLILMTFFSGVTLTAILVCPVNAPMLFGTVGVVLWSACLWVVWGAFIVANFANHRRWITMPWILGCMIFLAATLGKYGLTENHAIRQLEGEAAVSDEKDQAARRPSLQAYFAQWLRDRRKLASDRTAPYPLLITAAEGGGVRAAMWTATMLGTLQDRDPAFACHLFAIASISGSSMGALAFDALIDKEDAGLCSETRTEASNLLTGPELSAGEVKGPKEGGFAEAALNIFDEDMLAPTFAGMFFPDLLQRFVPTMLVEFPDRHAYLEQALEAAYQGWQDEQDMENETGSLEYPRIDGPGFSDGFLKVANTSLVDTTGPILFLIAADVTTGQRWIASEVRVDADIIKNAVDFLAGEEICDAERAECLDMETEHYALPASSAAGASARFPFISPSGTITDRETAATETARLLDGGTIETSGATTALDIFSALRSWCRPEGDLLVCQINEEKRDDSDPPPVTGCGDDGKNCLYVRPLSLILTNSIDSVDRDRPWFAGVLDPLIGLIGSWSERAIEAKERLQSASRLQNGSETSSFIELALTNNDDAKVPLTWTLSNRSKSRMRSASQLVLDDTTLPDVDKLRDQLTDWFPDPSTKPRTSQ